MLPLLITIQNVFFDAADRLKKDEKGATAVEYGLIVGLMAVIIIAAFAFLSEPIQDLMENVGSQLGGVENAG
ncbi:Flp family type IVb pilin [Kocuria rosea]|uniref:Flp family type IVb pilin n=1 Tax=Kocuria rosea TaxID=1275 RepID=UPI000E02B90E|nr:Flp family type IVb pilin [Kocuria rosea]STX06412.1 Flp pilus assembly protein, pilin Flp [Kocuria rosea]